MRLSFNHIILGLCLSCFFSLSSLAQSFAVESHNHEKSARLIFPDEIRLHREHSHFGNVVLHSNGNAISGFQFDLRYNREALTITPSLGSAAVSAAKSLSFNILPDGTLRVVVIGLNQTKIEDGVVVVLYAQATSECEERSYALEVTNASGTTPDGEPVSIRANNGRALFGHHEHE